MLCPCSSSIIKGIAYALPTRHFPPYAVLCGRGGRGKGESILEELPSIFEYILRDVSEVEVQLPTLCRRIVYEGIHEPKLQVLNVRCLEVRLIDLAHDACPALLGHIETSRGREGRGIEVVWAALLGVVAQRECREVARLAEVLILEGEELPRWDFPNEVVADIVGVIPDVGGGKAIALSGEKGINGKPSQLSPTLTIAEVVLRGKSLRNLRDGGRGEEPSVGIHQVDTAPRGLEVIQRAISLSVPILVMARDEMCKLSRDAEAGGSGQVK